MEIEKLIRQFTDIVPSSYAFSLSEVFLVIFLSFFLSLIIGMTYSKTHRGVAYNQTYVQNLLIITVVVSCIMLIVGSNIARAFTLLGALSIVRFRNAIKDSHDVGFIFFAMAVGMACGTRFYSMAIIMTLLICLMQIIITYFNFGKRDRNLCLLKVVWPMDNDRRKALNPILSKYFRDHSLAESTTISNQLKELSYIVTLKATSKEEEISRKIQEVSGTQAVTFVYGDLNIEV